MDHLRQQYDEDEHVNHDGHLHRQLHVHDGHLLDGDVYDVCDLHDDGDYPNNYCGLRE